MAEMVQIRSVKQYINDFLAEPLRKNPGIKASELLLIKNRILNEFKKELYGQIKFKFGEKAATMSKNELANLDGIQNILQNTFRKWRRLCILCTGLGLGNYFALEDLEKVLAEDEKSENPNIPDANVMGDEEKGVENSGDEVENDEESDSV